MSLKKITRVNLDKKFQDKKKLQFKIKDSYQILLKKCSAVTSTCGPYILPHAKIKTVP